MQGSSAVSTAFPRGFSFLLQPSQDRTGLYLQTRSQPSALNQVLPAADRVLANFETQVFCSASCRNKILMHIIKFTLPGFFLQPCLPVTSACVVPCKLTFPGNSPVVRRDNKASEVINRSKYLMSTLAYKNLPL